MPDLFRRNPGKKRLGTAETVLVAAASAAGELDTSPDWSRSAILSSIEMGLQTADYTVAPECGKIEV